MIRLPTQVTDAIDKASSDQRWSRDGPCGTDEITDMTWHEMKSKDDVVGYSVQATLSIVRDDDQSVANKVIWNFDLSNTIVTKIVAMDPPKYDASDLAQSLLDFLMIEWIRRESDEVTEYKAMVGDVCVLHQYNWSIPTSLRSTLEEELDLGKTELVPWESQLSHNEIWKTGHSEENYKPTAATREVMELIDATLKNADLLQYKSAKEVLESMEESTTDVPCDHCACAPCIWTLNESSIRHDNNYLMGEETTNKQRRFKAYKQMVFALYGHLGKGNRRKLPQCVVEGVQANWPEDNKRKYVGFKDE